MASLAEMMVAAGREKRKAKDTEAAYAPPPCITVEKAVNGFTLRYNAGGDYKTAVARSASEVAEAVEAFFSKGK